ncbi:MAG: ribose ABC transporter permease [Candidatus Hydrogenedens sp.]|nr:ribose ABC transporter permease [Candidatus Hydrogenedens sp.]
MTRFIAKHSPLFILAALCLALAAYSEVFRSTANLQSVATRTSEIAVLATGVLLVILTGGIDLSVGSVAALGGVLCCMAIKALVAAGVPDVLAVFLGGLAGAGVGLGCGTLNGVLITTGRIPPFIVTLGMMMAARGMALIVSGGNNIFGMPDAFLWLGGGKVWWVPIVVTVVIVAVASVTLSQTRFGRALYAIGGSLQAARLSGISVNGSRVAAYALSGLLAGFAGVMLASRTSLAAPAAAEMYELEAIAACVIGGASLMGGEGGPVAALAGALIMTVLRNFCNLQNIPVYWQQVLVGVLVVALVYYDNYRKRKAGLITD